MSARTGADSVTELATAQDAIGAPATASAGVSAGAELRLRDVRVGYDGVPVVAGLDLTVAAGEILVLLGPSGCGKSTLLRCVAGLRPVDSGDLLLGGEPIAGPSADRALAFQDDALLPWRGALRNVELPLAVRGVPRRERRALARDWLERVGLAGREPALPRELSGGMRQRVQLARTLVGRPKVALMDEPFGALDAVTRAAMQRLLIETWQASPTTILFVTHDVDEALRIGDRVAVLGGRPATLTTIVTVPAPRSPAGDPRTAAARASLTQALAAVAGEDGGAR